MPGNGLVLKAAYAAVNAMTGLDQTELFLSCLCGSEPGRFWTAPRWFLSCLCGSELDFPGRAGFSELPMRQ